QEFFEVHPHRVFALERSEPAKRGQKLGVKMLQQFHFRWRKIALRRRAQNYDHTDKSSPFPKKETDAVRTSLRRHVSTIKGGSRKAGPIAKKIVTTKPLGARRPESITLERFSCEEIV